MPDLTLEQVREAGRFAWWLSGRNVLFMPGIGIVGKNGAEDREDATAWMTDNGWLELLEVVPGIWHHLPGCDCEYCHE